jgi:hypothetical protein
MILLIQLIWLRENIEQLYHFGDQNHSNKQLIFYGIIQIRENFTIYFWVQFILW